MSKKTKKTFFKICNRALPTMASLLISVLASPKLAMAQTEAAQLSANGSCQFVTLLNQQVTKTAGSFSQMGVGWIVSHKAHSEKLFVLTPAHVSYGVNDQNGWHQTLQAKCGQKTWRLRPYSQSITMDLALLEILDLQPNILKPFVEFDFAHPRPQFSDLEGAGRMNLISPGQEFSPGSRPASFVIDLWQKEMLAQAGVFAPLVLRGRSAVRPGFSGTAIVSHINPHQFIGMVTKTEVNGERAFGVSDRDIYVASYFLFQKKDPWLSYDLKNPLIQELQSFMSRDFKRGLESPRRPYFDFELTINKSKNLERRRVLKITNSKEVYRENCPWQIKADTSDFYPVGRPGDFGDGSGSKLKARGSGDIQFLPNGSEFYLGQTNGSLYKNGNPLGCVEGVITSAGRLVSSVVTPHSSRRIGGVEDLFEMAMQTSENFETLLNTFGKAPTKDLATPKSFCSSATFEGSPALHFHVQETSVAMINEPYDPNIVGQVIAIATPGLLGEGAGDGQVTCNREKNQVRIAFNDQNHRIPNQLVNFDLQISDRSAEGEVVLGLPSGMDSSECRVLVNETNSRRIDSWTTEIKNEQLHMRIAFDTNRDLVRVNVLNAHSSCFPEKLRSNQIWLWQLLVRSM